MRHPVISLLLEVTFNKMGLSEVDTFKGAYTPSIPVGRMLVWPTTVPFNFPVQRRVPLRQASMCF